MSVRVSPGFSRAITVVRPMSSVASEVIFALGGPCTSWSIAAATRSPERRVWWISVAPASSLRYCSDISGSVSAASTRGSSSLRAGSCSLATSSDCTTSIAGASSTSTS